MSTTLAHGRRDSASHPRLGRRTRLLLLGGLGFGLLILATAFWFAIARPVKVLPRIKPLPAFALVDQYGLPLTSADLLGRMVMINVTYTGCGEACAAQRQGMVDLREALRARGLLGSRVLLLTVSFDPERDAGQALQVYAAQQGAERESWRFATGDPAALKLLLGGELGIYYGEPDASGQIPHEQNLLLVDGNGVLRARYNGEALDQGRLLRDVGMVAEEAGSTGVMRQVYEASHLFLCYPPD